MIPAVTAEQFANLQMRAQRMGRPLIEVLDEAGLLVTPARTDEIVEVHLRDLWATFERRDAVTFMRGRYGRADGTPAEMHVAIAGWLLAYVQQRITHPSTPWGM